MNLITLPVSIAELHFELVCPKLKKMDKKTGRVYYDYSVGNKLFEKKNNKSYSQEMRNVFDHLYRNIETIITGTVDDLNKQIENFNECLKINRLSLIEQDGEKSNLFNAIQECFDYDAYSKSEKPYKTLLKINYNTCPYCNRQYINTYVSTGSTPGRMRATLDHFYSKSNYPYLALSLYNLIPSCYSCNSSLKLDQKFTTATHIHPYSNSFDNIVKFSINFKKAKNTKKYIANFYQDPNYLEIGFNFLVDIGTDDYKRASGNISAFQLEHIYNFHKDQVIELLQKFVHLSNGYPQYVAKNYPKLFNDENDIKRMLVGNYLENDKFHKRPFSRIINDLCEEIGFKKMLDTL
ncbi:hypothetical protein [Sphingobacterium thalpophilum]|uniref:hypothetical protein n=1 Tax=Sphingobacterium thalpophilum TaxID=259 RepID=UPI003D95E344